MYKIGLIGGHLTPAVAVIEELISNEFHVAKSEIIFFGKRRESGGLSEEYRTVQLLGIKFIPVFSAKINRYFTFRNFAAVIFFPAALLLNFCILIKFHPQVLVGFGGYLSLPLCLAAQLLRIKIIIHEGTVRAGAANRVIAGFADKILISFGSSKKYFPRGVLVGCPLRREIYTAKKMASKIPMLLICGGHLGSQAINKSISPIAEKLLEKYIVVHQTGKLDYEKIMEKKMKLPAHLRMRYQIASYFDASEFSQYLANCNLVVSRSGINTVAEVLYLEKKAIFIPLPFSQNNEQMENARLAVDEELAVIIDQKKLSASTLLQEIDFMFDKPLPDVVNKYQIQFRQAAYNIAQIIINECS